MSAGFLYVLINPAIPGLAKVGRTTRNPSERVAELSSATGVPSPFLLAYQHPVVDCTSAERWVHAELERQGYRHASNREFFNAPLHEIIKVVAQVEAITVPAGSGTDRELASGSANQPYSKAEELFALAQQYAEGTADLIRDDKAALALFEQAAVLGHATASWMAATRYRFGIGARQDANKALVYYQKAVAQGMWFAEAFIAGLFLESGQVKDAATHWKMFFDSASECARHTLDEASVDEINVLNQAFEFGAEYCLAVASGTIEDCVPDRISKAVWQSIEKAINSRLNEEGEESFASELGTAMLEISRTADLRAALHFVENKLEKCIDVDLFLQMAESGNVVAQAGLATLYELGHGVEQNIAEAVKWLHRAAEQGNVDAQRNLAGKYYQGRGVEQNYDKAAEWFLKAAEQGDLDCQFNVANLFLLGHGVTASNSESFKWFLKTAQLGHNVAQFNVAAMYENGQGIEVNHVAAAKWYKTAAEVGNAQAQFQLGQLYELGHGVEQNYGAALELYRKAADADHINAQYCLGRLYQNGTGVAVDLFEARRWYTTAAANGQPDAAEALTELEAT